ncbi:F-box domain-containing protein [Mycena indigotica]|uniref:F-box domain-containing protein n=1 Tax=Mycena indigotica TaxID=2126181 RepID=A0A8H6S1R5_9AGAR|nr:F-box domain-containing protein [Mycena indigotica]KAF7290842.1 F-box domain-containing protein [Mycena indigotica]
MARPSRSSTNVNGQGAQLARSASWITWKMDPPAHLFETNEPPSDHDARIVRQIIAQQRERVSSLDGDIARLQSRLRKLEKERREMRERIEVNLTLVSPLRSLPVEVLEDVFWFAIPEPREMSTLDFDRLAPWNVAQVCWRWRDVAQRFPGLWSTICVNLSDTPPTPALLVRQLELTANRPLHIYFSCVASLNLGLKQLAILVQHASRWELADLRILGAAHSDVQAVLKGVQGRMSRLRFLRLEVQSSVLYSQVSPYFRDSSGLRHLTLFDANPGLRFPWKQLASLELTASAETMLRILQQCPNLMECRLRPLNLRDSLLTDKNMLVQLTHLRKFYSTDTRIFELLTLPALTHLFLPHDCTLLVNSLVQRSQCSLQHLYAFEGCSSSMIRGILAQCPAITTLGMQLSSTWELSDILHKLTFKGAFSRWIPGKSVLAPNLTTFGISLTGPLIEDAALEDIFETVEARSENKLRVFGLFLSHSVAGDSSLERLLGRLELLKKRLYTHIEYEDGANSRWAGGCVPALLDREGWRDPIVYLS